jgi:vitamin B12 transporter
MQYGSAAMGGVVNVITKRGRENLEIRAQAGFGSEGRKKYAFRAGKRLGALDMAAAASVSSAGDSRDGAGQTIRNSALGAQAVYHINLGWNFGPEGNRLGLSLTGSEISRAGNNAVERFADGASVNPAYRGKEYLTAQSKGANSLDLLYQGRSLGGKASWLLRYYQGKSWYRTERTVLGIGPPWPSEFRTSLSRNLFRGAQGQLAYDMGFLALTLGADWLGYDLDQSQPLLEYGYGNALNRTSRAKSAHRNLGAFLMAKARLGQSLSLTGGLRRDLFQVDTKSLVGARARPDDRRSFKTLLPSLGLAWSPIEELKLRASYAQAYRVPTPRNLIGNFYMGSLFYLGNPNLLPERSATWDAGADMDIGGLFQASASYFSTRFENFITADRNHTDQWGRTGSMYINVPKALIDGTELSLGLDLGENMGWPFRIRPKARWTHLFHYQDKDSGRKLPEINRDVLSYGLDFEKEDIGLWASLSATYYGMPEATVFNSQAPPEQRGGATVWDLSLAKSLRGFREGGGIKLRLSLENVFGKHYQSNSGIYMPGRTIYASLAYELE